VHRHADHGCPNGRARQHPESSTLVWTALARRRPPASVPLLVCTRCCVARPATAGRVVSRSAGSGGMTVSRMSWIKPPAAQPTTRSPQEVTSPHLNEKPKRCAKRRATPYKRTPTAADVPTIAARRRMPPATKATKLATIKATMTVDRDRAARQLIPRVRGRMRGGGFLAVRSAQSGQSRTPRIIALTLARRRPFASVSGPALRWNRRGR
jgi:hypothetical protein